MQLQHRESMPRERGSGDLRPLRVAYLSTYPPRECGLATFCADLTTATVAGDGAAEPFVIAMESGPRRCEYRWPVVLIVEEERERQYEAAADFLNEAAVDVACVQHEFGIFGGPEGRGLHRFLDRLARPAVITLHTVIPEPERRVRAHVRDLVRYADRLVVMNALAIDTLCRDYGIERGKIALIHHGAMAPSCEARDDAKARLGLCGRQVLSTFGLVGRGKGLQYALAALPEIRRRHPDVCYVIAGQTHPGVKRVEKESYREELTQLVAELGVGDSVRFVNRYLSKSEIFNCLAATDVYITPYLNPEQVTSGTLAYAVAAGRAVVSTPYAYARFLLEEAGGLLVDFRSERGIAAAVTEILDDPDLQGRLEQRSRMYGRQMLWPAVGAQYLSLFQQVLRERPVPVDARDHVQPQLSLSLDPGGEHYYDTQRDRKAAVARPLATAD